MTTHTNCTHPATKAARAACRKGTTVAPTTAPSSPLATDYTNVDYAFDSTTCDRCSGTGYLPHYAGVYGGVCFKCNKSGNNKSKGRVLTRAGQAARKVHDAWIAEHLMVRADSLKPGDKFRPSQVDGWKTVVSVDEPRPGGYSITRDAEGNEIRTPFLSITIHTQKMSWGMSPDSLVQRAATPAERNELIARIAGLKGTILTAKGE